jgi:hypothetical protein
MKGKLSLRDDCSREIPAGTQIRDGLDSYTLEETAKLRRGWVARLLGWMRRKATINAVREDRMKHRSDGTRR